MKDKSFANLASHFMVVSLKGISQVILIENAVTGGIILLAIMISSFSLGVIALLSSMIGALIGWLAGADKKAVNEGIFGFNSVLVGMALHTFLTGSSHWILSLSGALLAAILTVAFKRITKKTGFPFLTLPFVVLTLSILFISAQLGTVEISEEIILENLTDWETDWELDVTDPQQYSTITTIFTGLGQVFMLDYTISGVLLFVAVFLAGWQFAVCGLLGNAAALLTAVLMGVEGSSIFMGLYGYNGILTAIAISIIYNKDTHWVTTYMTGIVAAGLTVPVSVVIHTWLLPYDLPTLTVPFVLVTWMFLGVKKILRTRGIRSNTDTDMAMDEKREAIS